jgi:hypothetical protein
MRAHPVPSLRVPWDVAAGYALCLILAAAGIIVTWGLGHPAAGMILTVAGAACSLGAVTAAVVDYLDTQAGE